jgi:4-amino-4-deoxy-L-arabinose transferase-like glycosyltransferase
MTHFTESRVAPRPQAVASPSAAGDLSRGQFALALLLVACAALALRLVYPVADPPSSPTVGVVWHDEGAWVHNARNRVLFGEWKLDEWNPMYVTPVLTGLEYLSFRAFGVGLRQARLVPELLGVLSVLLVGLGVARIANRFAGVIAAALLATNFVYVSYNRAATIEATMVAFLVMAWYGYARAGDSPRWGLVAGLGAILAYFTKASAVFFVAALGFDALLSLVLASDGDRRSPGAAVARRGAFYTLAGLVVSALAGLVVFVLPNWQAYSFYNWQISVTRKPSYTLRALMDRASQLPLAADLFTRMWLVVVVSVGAALARLTVWARLRPAERLLILWVGLGVGELVVHDIQERRLLILIPAMVALAAIALARCRLTPAEIGEVPRARAWLISPLVAYGLYAMVAPIARLPFMAAIDPGEHPGPVVRTAAVVAVLTGLAILAGWRRASAWLGRQEWKRALTLLIVALVVAGDFVQFGQWASVRSYKNYEAMVQLGRWLPPGTLVHGKLANGLALENLIRPVFVGRGFGNYADRRNRDDVRYVVTYISPFIGYEGGRDAASRRSIICDVLDAYPRRRILHVFDVAESPGGHDAAMLIDKMPGQVPPRGNDGDTRR